MPDPKDPPPPSELSEQVYRAVFEDLSDGVYLVSPSRQIIFWNGAAERISGFSRAETVGSFCHDNLLRHVDESGRQLCDSGCPLHATIADSQTRHADVSLHHKRGHRVPVAVTTIPLRNPNGEVLGAIEVFADRSNLSGVLRRVEELEQVAFLDPLTGAGNRRFAEQVLRQRLSELSRYDWPFGVVLLDIDHFKEVNDRHGHPMGDEVLKTVFRTLHHSIRAHDFVGRWGGDEFLLVLAQKDVSRMLDLADRLRNLVAASEAILGGERVRVTASLGVTWARSVDQVEDLIARADRLLYESKSRGRNLVTNESGPTPTRREET